MFDKIKPQFNFELNSHNHPGRKSLIRAFINQDDTSRNPIFTIAIEK